MSSTELAARRGVDFCLKLLRNPHLTATEAIQEAQSNQSKHVRVAAHQFELLRAQLREDVSHWLTTGECSGLLTRIPEGTLLELLGQREEIPAPPKDPSIPTLDMNGLQFEADAGKTRTPRTSLVSDIPPYGDIEVVEVSDSSAYDSQLLDVVAGQVIKRKEGDDIPTVSARNLGSKTTRSDNFNFCQMPLTFIPSFPLKVVRKEASVQTERKTPDTEMTDAATSYNLEHFQDIGEVSTSTSSDPSLGQLDSRLHPQQIIRVKADGSVVVPEGEKAKTPRVEEINWKPPLELVRIAERDISSSFGSDEIESIRANRLKAPEESQHSDDEPTVNQVSQMDSEASN